MRFFKAYRTKNIGNKKCAEKLNAFKMDILCGTINIPDGLLLSRARFRFLMSDVKLNLHLYIYNLS
jgi:hypothetical protein